VNLGLAGKRAIVTGGSRGIGRAIAEELVAEGAHVSLCGRTREALDDARAELSQRAPGATVHSATCDVGVPDALARYVDEAARALGGLDVLINNASAMYLADDAASWEQSYNVDLMGAVRACGLAEPWLLRSGSGAIVHIVSTAALEAPGPAPYSALKAALISHAKNLAVRLASHRIRVNCVAPGCIDHPGGLWAQVRASDPARYEAVRTTIPSGRLGTAAEVARATVFLASPAASWVTGAVLAVDGGQHKGNL
jgi:3-oxoacyl-[acyl-carrier protein] reductase